MTSPRRSFLGAAGLGLAALHMGRAPHTAAAGGSDATADGDVARLARQSTVHALER